MSTLDDVGTFQNLRIIVNLRKPRIIYLVYAMTVFCLCKSASYTCSLSPSRQGRMPSCLTESASEACIG